MTQALSNLIGDAVAAKLTPEFVAKEVDARVDVLIRETISDAFRSWSDTAKLVKESMEAALKVERLDLPSYGTMVTQMLKAQIEATVAPIVAGRLAEDMQELLRLAPKTIKLSEIAKGMIEGGCHEDKYGEVITVIVEHNDYGSTWIYLDDDNHYERHKKHNCAVSMLVSMLVSKDGTIHSASFHGRDLKTTKHIGTAYGLEQRVRAWVACGTVIEIDEDYVVTSTGDY